MLSSKNLLKNPLQSSDRISVQYEFDKGDSAFEVGDTVSGTAVVTANQETVCNKILVQMRWQTHGRGNRDSGKWIKESVQVPHNKLSANETHRIPFSFHLPAGPLTYRGSYLNIDWYLKTIVDARGPFDPSHEEEIIVLPKVLETAYISNYTSNNQNQATPIQINNSQRDLIVGLAMLGGAIMTIAIVFVMGFPPFFALFGLVTLGISSLFFYKSIRNSISTQKLGPIKMEIPKTELLPDETFNCHLSFNPLQDVTVNGITFQLQGNEKVISGSGSNRKTHSTYIFKKQYVQLENKSLLANEEVRLDQQLQLPPNAAYSFSSEDNKLEWFCEVTIDVEGWPNWKERLDLRVVPWRVLDRAAQQQSKQNWSEYEDENLALK